jgi:hypothetical protein
VHLVSVTEEMLEHIVIFYVSWKAVYKELLAVVMTPGCFLKSPIAVHFFKSSCDFDVQLAVLLLHVEDCLMVLHCFVWSSE